jgi:hypothetical protein
LSRTRIFVLAALTLALATAFTACGSGGGSDDPQQTIEEATLKGVESGTLDLKFSIDSAGGNLDVSLSGPFQSTGKESLPELDLTAKANGDLNNRAVDFEGGLTLLSDRAFVEYEGEEYEVDPTTFGFVKSGFEQADQQGGSQDANGPNACQEAAKGIKIGDFVDNLKSEGGAEVDGTKTTKISGDLNIEGGIDAILELAENQACASQIEAAGQASLSQLEAVQGQLADAIKKAHADVFVGEDNIIRRITGEFSAEEGGETVEFNFDFSLGNVNQDQKIKAPTGAKPLEGLFEKLGVNPLELFEGLSGGGSGGDALGELFEKLSEGGSSGSSTEGSEGSPAYIECLQEVETSADLQKCANLAK